MFMNNVDSAKMIETYRRFLNTVAFVYLDGINDSDGVGTTEIHGAVRDWYMLSINKDIEDRTVSGSNNLGICASTPTDYVYAMKGKAYSQRNDGEKSFLLDNDYEVQIDVRITRSKDYKTLIDVANPTGQISGIVNIYKKTDDNALINAYEGMTVSLLDGNKNVIKTALSDVNGRYLFNDLSAGDYYIQYEKARDFYTGNSDLNTYYYSDVKDYDQGLTEKITLSTNHSYELTKCIVNAPTGQISGIVRVNKTIKNSLESLASFEGMTVNLLDSNKNIIKTTLTDVDGRYVFTELAAGDYYVQFDKSRALSFYKGNSDLDAELYYSDVTDYDNGLTEKITLSTDKSISEEKCIVNYTASYIFAIIIALVIVITIGVITFLLVRKQRHNKAVISIS
jgi:hypothetical protein